MKSKTILITVDLEDWFQVENFKDYIHYSQWENKEYRFESNTRELLDIFYEHQIKATFFIVGWNAERTHGLVREIYEQGHEVASHGYTHQMCSVQSKNVLCEDLRKSKLLLEDIIGAEVKGYRAPSFSINNQAIILLKELGYTYDSSYNTFGLNNRHGKLDLSDFHRFGIAYIDSDGFSEIPISNLKTCITTLPWPGGGYFRLFPSVIFNAGVSRILNKEKGYIFYMHPWEIDPAQPRVLGANFFFRFRHYLNLDKSKDRLSKFIDKFRECTFMTCTQYLDILVNKRTLI